MLFALAALATPPDILNSSATLLCSGPGEVVFELRTHGNRGSHYLAAYDRRLMRLKTAARALAIDPTNHTARFNLACAHARSGRAAAAVEVLGQLPPPRA